MQTSLDDISVFIVIATTLVFGLVLFVIFILFLYQKKQVAYLKSLDELKLDHEKNLLKTQLEIQEQTFQNISREIHDNIGLSLTLAKLNLNVLEIEKEDKAAELISSSIDLIGKSINDLSDISKCLNSEAISQQGFLNALRLEVERLNKLNRFSVDFKISGNPVFFESNKELVLFRIAQEALNNVIKHAYAKNIHMEVSFTASQVRLTIRDDGKGFIHNGSKKRWNENMKSGLANMDIRSSLIEGHMELMTEPGKGTTVVITAPLDNN